MSLPALLRAGVLALLAAALLAPGPWRDAAPAPRAPHLLAPGGDAEGWAAAVLLGGAPPAVGRLSAAAPDGAELDVLAAAARRAPLYAAAPVDREGLTAEAPLLPRAGRAAAVGFRLRAAPGDSVTVRIADGTGVLDSVRVRADAEGAAAGAFRVRPAAAGWGEWTLTAGELAARTGARVDSAAPPRVWVRAGLPHWEAAFLVRALEESGAVVETAFDLGRGLAVEQGGGGAVTAERLARYDAVVLLDGAPVSDAERSRLADWAAERGGGVLLTGAQAAAPPFALVAGAARETALPAEAIRWHLPADLAPLPAAALRSAAVAGWVPAPGTVVAAEAEGGAVVALRALGRGRVAGVSLVESWRWRMEAGNVEAHREFWRALVDWVAAGPGSATVVRVPEPLGAAGVRREVLVQHPPGAGAPPPLVVVRPAGGADTLAAAPVEGRPGVYRAWIVPADTGVYELAVGEARAAFRAAAAGDGADGWARLSLLAHASGGGVLPPDSLRAALRRHEGPVPGGGRQPLAWLLFAAVLLLAGAEWLIRRLRGRA